MLLEEILEKPHRGCLVYLQWVLKERYFDKQTLSVYEFVFIDL